MTGFGSSAGDRIGRKETGRVSLLFLLAVACTMLLFSLYGAKASVFEKARETLLDVTAPVLGVLGAPVRWIDARVDNIGHYFDVMEKNRELRAKNAELEGWMQESVSLRRQVAYYENVLDVKMPNNAQIVDARVIGETNGPYNHAMVLNAGARDGIQEGNAVINQSGLVGHVIEAGRRASRILLLTDFNSRTPVFVEGADIEAILAGRYRDQPELVFFAQRDRSTIKQGMRIVTSGAGGSLPRGLHVGEVTKVSEEHVSIALYANYHATDTVRVIDYTYPEIEAPSSEGATEQETNG